MSQDLGPFFQSEAAMFDNMRNAVGTSSNDNWVKMMIAHHEGGAAISRDVLAEAPPARIAELANRVIVSQNQAVRELEALVRPGPPNLEIAHIISPSLEAMYNATMAVQGPDASEVWLRKIIEHHCGAIAMSDALMARGAIPQDIVGTVLKLRQAKRRELAKLEQALAEIENQRDLQK
tara:strand:+ start:25862 stop:26395 length:534 start_codon:yes stop_codon:yes gene_type:complete